jgi:hypothetical protein
MNFNKPQNTIMNESKDRNEMKNKIKHALLFDEFKRELKMIILSKLSDSNDKS